MFASVLIFASKLSGMRREIVRVEGFSSGNTAGLALSRSTLLPYKKHFFICPPGAIRSIGLDPDDPDWERVRWDCARPKDEEAYRRLCEKRDKFEAARSR